MIVFCVFRSVRYVVFVFALGMLCTKVQLYQAESVRSLLRSRL